MQSNNSKKKKLSARKGRADFSPPPSATSSSPPVIRTSIFLSRVFFFFEEEKDVGCSPFFFIPMSFSLSLSVSFEVKEQFLSLFLFDLLNIFFLFPCVPFGPHSLGISLANSFKILYFLLF